MEHGKIFHCKVRTLNSFLVFLHNGRFDNKALQVFAPPAGIDIEMGESPEHIKIRLAKGVHLKNPIQLVNYVDTPTSIESNNRLELILEEGASMTFIHCDETRRRQPHKLKMSVEITLARHSALKYNHLLNINGLSELENETRIIQSQESSLKSVSLCLNGLRLKKDLRIELSESHAQCDVFGLSLLDENQRDDLRVSIDHQQPECRSRQHFKSIIDDLAMHKFTGHIRVAPGAQKTEAIQNCNGMQLTEKAKTITLPLLEIYADDVKCAHGATIGMLDEDASFYMRSRGIPAKTARTLLMVAFAEQIIQEIDNDALRQYQMDLVSRRLAGENLMCACCFADSNGEDLSSFA